MESLPEDALLTIACFCDKSTRFMLSLVTSSLMRTDNEDLNSILYHFKGSGIHIARIVGIDEINKAIDEDKRHGMDTDNLEELANQLRSESKTKSTRR